MAKETMKGLYRRALKLRPQEDEGAIADVLELLSALDALLP